MGMIQGRRGPYNWIISNGNLDVSRNEVNKPGDVTMAEPDFEATDLTHHNHQQFLEFECCVCGTT